MLHRQNTRANTRNIKLETTHKYSSTRYDDTHSHWTEKLPSCSARASRYIVRGVEYSGNVRVKSHLRTVCRLGLVAFWVVLCADIDLWCYELCADIDLWCYELCADVDLWCYELCCVQTLTCEVMSCVVCRRWLVVLWVVLCADVDLWCYELCADVDLWCYELCCVQTLTCGVMSCVQTLTCGVMSCVQ